MSLRDHAVNRTRQQSLAIRWILGSVREKKGKPTAEKLAADPGFATAAPELRERHRLLKGVMLWDLDRGFRERSWRAHRALRDLDRELATAEAQLAGIQAAGTAEPARFEEFAARIAALAPRIGSLQAAVAATLHRQEDTLVAMAVQELGAQKERLASYRVQARFALATLYDRASTQAATGRGAAP